MQHEAEAILSRMTPKSSLMGRFFDRVPMDGDLITILIRGHLIVEEQLNAALRTGFPNPDYLEKAKLRFSQLVPLVKALYFAQDDSPLWGAIVKINEVRNKYAHQVEPKNVEELTQEFLNLVDTDYSECPTTEEKLHMAIALVAARINELYEQDT